MSAQVYYPPRGAARPWKSWAVNIAWLLCVYVWINVCVCVCVRFLPSSSSREAVYLQVPSYWGPGPKNRGIQTQYKQQLIGSCQCCTCLCFVSSIFVCLYVCVHTLISMCMHICTVLSIYLCAPWPLGSVWQCVWWGVDTAGGVCVCVWESPCCAAPHYLTKTANKTPDDGRLWISAPLISVTITVWKIARGFSGRAEGPLSSREHKSCIMRYKKRERPFPPPLAKPSDTYRARVLRHTKPSCLECRLC